MRIYPSDGYAEASMLASRLILVKFAEALSRSCDGGRKERRYTDQIGFSEDIRYNPSGVGAILRWFCGLGA